jgi:hypothetical protein
MNQEIKVERTGQVNLIAPEHVIDQACLVHDCSTGNCHFTGSETTVTVEREAVQKVTYSLFTIAITITTW